MIIITHLLNLSAIRCMFTIVDSMSGTQFTLLHFVFAWHAHFFVDRWDPNQIYLVEFG